jgi:hypothetical protein
MREKGPMRGILLNIPAAQVADGELWLRQFRSSDPDVVALVAQADDPDAAVRHALSVGARVLRIANANPTR